MKCDADRETDTMESSGCIPSIRERKNLKKKRGKKLEEEKLGKIKN